jgi:hypothetical protein
MIREYIKKTVIVVLGGGLKKTKTGWSTTNLNNKGDLFGVCGDRLRILATGVLYNILSNRKNNILIIASGGKGQYCGINSPVLSKIIKKELVEIGIPSNLIVKESNSNNTYGQLKESSKIFKKKKISAIMIVSNRYHLPRIKAFIKSDSKLKEIYGKIFKLKSAEDILIASDPKKWRSFISNVYASKSMKKRIILEKEGINKIKKGTYFSKK